MPKEIANSELTAADLPPPGAVEKTIWRFAASFDGYGYVRTRPLPSPPANQNLVWRLGILLANPVRGEFFQSGVLPRMLSDLRACLFFEGRRLHHQDVSASPDMLRYLHALVEEIRQKLRAGEVA